MRENGVFFTPVKYTLVCRTPWVSWAARHTTVCLDGGQKTCQLEFKAFKWEAAKLKCRMYMVT